MIHLRFTVSALGVGRYGFDSSQEQVIFRYSTKFRPVLGTTHPLIQWVTKALCLGVGRPGSEAGYSLPPSVKVTPHIPSDRRAAFLSSLYLYSLQLSTLTNRWRNVC
jgi:hypothetical protein